MGRISLEQAALWCGGKIDPKYKDVTFLGANNDTRKLEKDQLFLALKGARDGHDFIPAALENGAAAVLCQHCDGDYPAIVVPDVRVALGQIAAAERQRIGMKVVGVTGSVGKSTTKEMIACVLEGSFRVEKTPVNHNNDIGMPMAILAMPEDTQVAVLEMGMNHFGEIAYLSNIARPEIGVIINVGTMHIEHLGSREGILQAKMEILEGMDENGRLFLNGDNDLLYTQKNHPCAPVFFGAESMDCSVYGYDIRQSEGNIKFRVKTAMESFSVSLGLEGEHFVGDALAAICVGLELGVDPFEIRERLFFFRNMEGRQEIFRAGEYTIIKDCYNAGPESMRASLRVLGNRNARRIAVLGEMLELGEQTREAHYQVGVHAADNADVLLCYGPSSADMVCGAQSKGMVNAQAFDDKNTMAKALKAMALPGDVILFKGSRGVRMEQVLDAFLMEEK